MAIYVYECPNCKYTVEQIRRNPEENVPTCFCEGKDKAFTMKLVLSTPSAPQWRCSTVHSRSKGF